MDRYTVRRFGRISLGGQSGKCCVSSSRKQEVEGIYPAYHMNKTHWISIAMDDRVPRVLVQDLLDQSYASTASAPRRQKKR